MTAEALPATGGLLTIGGAGLFGLAWVISTVFDEPVVAGVELARWVAIPAHILMLLSLVAIYLVQADRVGGWGLAGFLLAFSGVAIFIGYVIGGWSAAIPEPRLGPVGGMLWLAGLLILAIVTWQGGVLPRWSGVLWFAGAVVYATGLPAGPDDQPGVAALIGALIIAGGLGWAGVSMVSLD